MKKTILFILITLFFLSCSNTENESSSSQTESEACIKIKGEVNKARELYISSPQNSIETNCKNYLNILKDQITVCGDQNGEIQKTIDSLKDCTSNT